MAYFWREPVGLLSAHREYEKFLSVLWFTEYSPTVFSLWGTCEKMVNIVWISKKNTYNATTFLCIRNG